MSNTDLLKWTTSDVDFYELLGITFENCTESELRRAYRKTALKYHPDKVGAAFDPDKYELFQAANEVLSDHELKAKYDNHRNAKLQKQRAHDLFQGKRRQMKDDLEARERGAPTAGMKRQREEGENEIQKEMKRMAEEGRKRRAARQEMMAENARSSTPAASSPAPAPSEDTPAATSQETHPETKEEDDVERLERLIREAAERKASKKARKSGVFTATASPALSVKADKEERETATPLKRPDLFKGIKADSTPSASPKFSFSPNPPKPANDFAATMARLKAAERQRMEDEIREQEKEMA